MTTKRMAKTDEAPATTIAAKPNSHTCTAHPYMLAFSVFQYGFPEEAMHLAHSLAERGDATSRQLLGVYYNTTGTPQGYHKAVHWYRRAAESGYSRAQAALDELLAWEEDKIESEMFECYADNTDLREGFIYERRFDEWCRPVSRREKTIAAHWYLDLALSGEAEGEFLYGLMLFRGLGVRKDEVRARGWFRKAARQGHLGAKAMIGFLHLYGRGVQTDPVRGREWLIDAARGGHAPSQRILGYYYSDGYGVPRDEVAGAEWYEKSAMQDYVLAQEVLAKLYREGRGVPRNLILAHMWGSLAKRHRCE
jgi:TPR repeat protein